MQTTKIPTDGYEQVSADRVNFQQYLNLKKLDNMSKHTCPLDFDSPRAFCSSSLI